MHRIPHLGAVFCLVAACAALFGEHYSFEHLGLRQSLGSLSVRAIAEHDGLIWAGTSRGLFSFDGNRFYQHTRAEGQPLDNVGCFYAEPGGDLYIAGLRGMARYSQGRFAAVPLPAANGGGPRFIFANCMAKLPDGRILAAAEAGLFAGRGSEFELLASYTGHEPNSVLAVPGGPIYVATSKGLLRLERNGQQWALVPDGEGLEPQEYYSPALDKDGTLWLRARGKLYVRERGAPSFRRLPITLTTSGRNAGIYPGPDGRIWVPSFEGLRAFSNPQDFTLYSSMQGLPADDVSVIQFSNSGSAWIGMDSHGLVRWHGWPSWTSWNRDDGLSSDEVMSFALDASGHLWVGSRSGLNRELPSGKFAVFN
jgi:ligand-binding sensor domain-containing protein